MTNKKEILEEFRNQREALSDHFLTNEDYDKLYSTAETLEDETLKYIMRVLKETGIRYSSLKDLTVEAVNLGEINYILNRTL